MRILEGTGVFGVVFAVADLGEVIVGVFVGGLLKIFGERGEGRADDVEAVRC